MTKFPTRDEFEAWLRGFDPGAVVGIAEDGSCCPIAQYLTRHGAKGVQVDQLSWSCDGPLETRVDGEELPSWGTEFIQHVDGNYQDSLLDDRVIAAEALEILKSMKEAA